MSEIFYNENNKPTGHFCTCGEAYKWAPYIFAHWNHEIIYTCAKCKAETIIQSGKIVNVT